MTIMTARYAGKCAVSGRAIKPGDRIDYDRSTRTASLVDEDAEPSDASPSYQRLAQRSRSRGYVSHVFTTSGGTFYRNKQGRCEDAPCCGCCTI